MSPTPQTLRSLSLSQKTLVLAARDLASRDKILADIFFRLGAPPLWRRPTGFHTLVHIILEQQVSLKSGAAMFERLKRAISPFGPERILAVGEGHLRGLGVTRQKAAYLVDLASALEDGRLNLGRLGRMGDNEAKLSLMRVKGIGAWSAEVYLLMAMRRADVWPAGDLALAVAAQEVFQLEYRPGPEELIKIAERWRPLRAVAARMLWQHYLAKRGRQS